MRSTRKPSRGPRRRWRGVPMRGHLISPRCTYLESSTHFVQGASICTCICTYTLICTWIGFIVCMQIIYYCSVVTYSCVCVFARIPRLERLTDLLHTVDMYESLGLSRLDGIETFNQRFMLLFSTLKKKPYDVLESRKADFEMDYDDFKRQLGDLNVCICLAKIP